MRYDAERQIWAPLSVAEVGAMFAACPARWWLSGGWAIDYWLGGPTRRHGDIDVSTLRPDLAALLGVLPRHLRPYGAVAGHLVPLERCGEDPAPHNIWVRDPRRDRWVLQINVEEGDATTWRYRRDPRVTRPWSQAVVLIGGLPTGSPTTQLLWKARDPRTRDEHDLDVVLRALSDDERRWLRSAIGTAHAESPWTSDPRLR